MDSQAPDYGTWDVCEGLEGEAREESDRHGPLSMTSPPQGVLRLGSVRGAGLTSPLSMTSSHRGVAFGVGPLSGETDRRERVARMSRTGAHTDHTHATDIER